MTTDRSIPRRAARGFTLLEVMVTLSIIGLIMTAIYTVLFGTLKAKQVVEVKVAGSRIGPLLLDQIEHDLRQVFTYNLDLKQVFIGKDRHIAGRAADKIHLVAETPSTSAIVEKDKTVYSPVNEIGFVLTENPENPDFMILWRREDFFVDDNPLEDGLGTPLYNRVTGFNVRYFDRRGKEAEDFDEWDPKDRPGLPAAMEITLSLEVEPREQGSSLTAEELARRTYTFRRWISFPDDINMCLAVRSATPVPTDESGNPIKKQDKGKDGDKGPNVSDGSGTSTSTGGGGKGGGLLGGGGGKPGGKK